MKRALSNNNVLLATPKYNDGDMYTSGLEYSGDKITGYSGSAFYNEYYPLTGNPSGFTNGDMYTSGLEYSGDKITGYSGTAFYDEYYPWQGNPSGFLQSGDALAAVVHDTNLSGSGTDDSPLGLSNEINIIGMWGDTATLNPYSLKFHSNDYSGEYGQYDTLYYANSGKEAMTAGVGTFRLLDETNYADKQDLIIRPYDIDISRGDFQSNLQASSFSIWQNNGGADMLLFDYEKVMLSSRYNATARLENDKLTFTDPIGQDRAIATYSPYQITYTYPLINETITATVGSTGMVCYYSNGSCKAEYAGRGSYISAASGGVISANPSTGGNNFGIIVELAGSTAKLNHTALQLKDSVQTATIDAATWNSLTAWATAQGWTNS